MRSTIDAGGRVVVPKSIREALHLVPGAVLEVTERDGAIVIEPAPVSMRLLRRGGSIVVDADQQLPVLTAEMVRDTLESIRR